MGGQLLQIGGKGHHQLGDVVHLTITGTVNSNTASQTITNTAVSSAADEGDTDSTDNSAQVTFTVQEADLQVRKLVYRSSGAAPGSSIVTVNAGDTVTYTVIVINGGPDMFPAGSVVSDILPGTLTFGGAWATGGTPGNSGNAVLWTLPSLSLNDVVTLTITATVNSSTAGQTILNTAAISSATQGDRGPLNNSDVATVTVSGADLQVSKSVVPGTTVLPGGTITYTVVVTNNGPDTATGVVISDTLPEGLTFGGVVDGSPLPGDYAESVWNLGELTKGGLATLSYTATVNAGTVGQTLVNTAVISSIITEDSISNNDVATATITVAGFDLTISKSAVRNNTESNGVLFLASP